VQELSRCRAHLEQEVSERAESVKRAEQDRFHSERAELVRRMIGAVSHELRNPLGTIHASAYALAERMRETDQPVDDLLARVQRSINRCNTLVEQMSEFCRPRRLVKSTIELDEWLERVGPHICAPAPVELDLDSGVAVAMDRRRLRRALQALCDNARRATEDGSIVLRTRRADSKAYIMVEDRGPGMDAETARHALEPLYSTRPSGLGLGLPLARMIAQRHGGRLSIETLQGEGTTVTLTLPIRKREGCP
jgi:signal transduction histidine kinase